MNHFYIRKANEIVGIWGHEYILWSPYVILSYRGILISLAPHCYYCSRHRSLTWIVTRTTNQNVTLYIIPSYPLE